MIVMRRGVGALAAVALVLSGCSKEAPEDAPQKARDPLAEQATALRNKTPLEVAELTAQLSYDFERPLLTFAGLEAKLGGEQATNDALLGLMRAYKAQTLAVTDKVPRLTKASWEAQVGDGVGAMGSGYMLLMPLLVAISDYDYSGSQSSTDHGVDMTLSVQGDQASIEVETNNRYVNLSGKVKAKVVADLCPDPAGHVRAKITIDSSQTDGAGTGANTHVTAGVKRIFDDDAKITDGYDFGANVQQSAFEAGKGNYVDLSVTRAGGKISFTNNKGSAESDKQLKAAGAYIGAAAGMASEMLERAARTRVDAGHCVNLNVTTDPEKRSGAEPGSKFTIEAMPRAKSDGAMAAGTVVATLQGEGDLFEAGQKKRADAQFFYTAPKQKGQSGHILLESRSRRGVGKATVDVDTRQSGWRTTMSAVLLWPGGTICDPTRPFRFTDGQTTTDFNPEGDGSGGTFSLKTRQPFGSGSGGGSYRLQFAGDGRSGTLSMKGRVVFTVAGRNSPAAPIATDYPLEPTIGGCN